ncbi:uncharacterized protein EV422DRAFT_602002 [Fimicolochytrium jonesii]|uniref:uncharacterized protein n=1 Tax=Fimicolochytrium jonesii TaxID=1396493 RepID=UPI0022FEEF64|nr:uncharacterized protein EV422DRAFT_602002 [Fimicolochytrium jonesii]KAI8818585.1 hypothetical protein EV422DRAFT_602002 [Fimicolochytrium jonesii]
MNLSRTIETKTSKTEDNLDKRRPYRLVDVLWRESPSALSVDGNLENDYASFDVDHPSLELKVLLAIFTASTFFSTCRSVREEQSRLQQQRSDEDLLEDAWTKANPYLDLIDLIDPSPEAYGHEDFIPEYLAEVSEFIEMAKGYADISESDLFEFYEPSVDVYATAAGIGSGDANPKSMPYPGSLTDADEKDGDPISRDQDILLASAELGRDPRPEDIAKSNVAIYAPRMPEGVQLIHAVQVPRSKAVEPDWCSFYEVPTSSANVEETRVGGSGDLVKGKLKAGEDEPAAAAATRKDAEGTSANVGTCKRCQFGVQSVRTFIEGNHLGKKTQPTQPAREGGGAQEAKINFNPARYRLGR